MHPRSPWTALLLLAASVADAAAAGGRAPTTTIAASSPTTTATRTAATACVATHSTSGAFFDLRPDVAAPFREGEKHRKGARVDDYAWARPAEWPYNFTMNICAPVVAPVRDVVGVDEAAWRNISAWYRDGGKVYSLGQSNGTLIPRGSQLILRYTGGSPCGTAAAAGKGRRDAESRFYDYEEVGSNRYRVGAAAAKAATRRKSAILTFRCDRDPSTAGAKVSFIEADEDQCTYVFSVLSQHACARSEPHKPGSVGPGSVFAIIFFIAVLVYVLGGVMYQRNVAHARGWRQLPNYSLWSGIFGFFKDISIVLFASCLRLVRGRRGYRTLSASPSRGRNREDENRLIDQLDEEWED